MARFTATLTGTAPNQVLTVVDTGVTPNRTVMQTTVNIQSAINASPLATLAPIGLNIVEQQFETPYGTETEMGFDIAFTLTAGAADAQVGKFTLSGLQLKSPVDRLESWHTCRFVCRGIGTFDQTDYPGTMYSPVVVLRNTIYNLSMSFLYPVLEYNHSLNVRHVIDANDSKNPSTVTFFVANQNGHNPVFKIPAGQTRIYRIAFRISDRTNTRIGPANAPIDAATEWLWTVRPYQQYFRRLYGKPNYRAMGGWDGRVVSSMNTSHGPPPYVARWWQNDGANPTTGSGYDKFATGALNKQPLNIDRIMIWAWSGWHSDEGFNYAFRFATGVLSLNSTATDSVQPACRRIRAGTELQEPTQKITRPMQFGLWWGRCTGLDTSTNWEAPTQEPLDIDDPADRATCFAEMDLAVFDWRAQMIGLDAYALLERPGDGYRWLETLKARYPRVLLITEQALPDVYHILAPTYNIEAVKGDIKEPYWLQQFINPGSECFQQFNEPPQGQSPASRASQLSGMGFTVISGFFTATNENTRALGRWKELGESAISEYAQPHGRTSWRDRDTSLRVR